MLVHLSVQNYVLIDKLEIDFQSGFSVVTGETGAGKSILMGALNLLSGQRADISAILDSSRKCVVEGCFDIKKYGLESFFEDNEIDYSDLTIIRRELSADGRSRAFVNDSPINLSALRVLSRRLIDIHSQHDSLYLNDATFQLSTLDEFALNKNVLSEYKLLYETWNRSVENVRNLSDLIAKNEQERDYKQFRFEELDSAKLQDGEEEDLITQQKFLENAESIKMALYNGYDVIDGSEFSINHNIGIILSNLRKIANVYPQTNEFLDRLESVEIELKDLSREMSFASERTDIDPQKLESVTQRLDFIEHLLQKYHASSVSELIAIKDLLHQELDNMFNLDEELVEAKRKEDESYELMKAMANKLSERRLSVVSIIEQKVSSLLKRLGMPYGVFKVDFEHAQQYSSTGRDKVRFLFSANPQSQPNELSKVASGGELSRLMLSLKAVISERVDLPIIVFDEIDTGVSGDIADKMALIMSEMSQFAQIISITHLPQVASKGDHHYLVYKSATDRGAQTHISSLDNEGRVSEIARMLSGSVITEAAINNAKSLLNNL